MNCKDLIENGCLRRHERVRNLQASAEPMFGIKHIMGIAILELFNEPSLSGVTIQTNSQEGNLLNHLILAYFGGDILEVFDL